MGFAFGPLSDELNAEQKELCRLYQASVERGDVDEVLRLLKAGVPVDADRGGCRSRFPTIIGACDRGDVAIVRVLIERGATPIFSGHVDDWDGEAVNPLFSCALQRRFPDRQGDGWRRTPEENEAILTLLLQHHYKAEYERLLQSFLLISAAELAAIEWWEKGGRGDGREMEDRDRFAMLVDAGADGVLAANALHDACEMGDAVAVRALLARGACANGPEGSRAAPLEMSAEYWQAAIDGDTADWLECMRLLLSHGAMLTDVGDIDAAAERSALEACRMNASYDGDWSLDLDDDLVDMPPARLLRAARACHPFRVARARQHWRRIAPLVGRWRLFLMGWHTEVSYRPGHSGMLIALTEFEQCSVVETRRRDPDHDTSKADATG